jgi:hypothetical protein
VYVPNILSVVDVLGMVGNLLAKNSMLPWMDLCVYEMNCVDAVFTHRIKHVRTMNVDRTGFMFRFLICRIQAQAAVCSAFITMSEDVFPIQQHPT